MPGPGGESAGTVYCLYLLPCPEYVFTTPCLTSERCSEHVVSALSMSFCTPDGARARLIDQYLGGGPLWPISWALTMP